MSTHLAHLKPLLRDLESEHMYFEQVHQRHLDDIKVYLSDHEIRSRMRLATLDTHEKRQAWFDYYRNKRELGEMIQWTGYFKSDRSYASLLTLKEISWSDSRAELGYSVSKAHWGKGLASEAAALAVKYAFEVLNLHSLFAQISPDNFASQGVINKLGFAKEAHLKECYSYQGKYFDLWQYSLINPTH